MGRLKIFRLYMYSIKEGQRMNNENQSKTWRVWEV